MGWRSPAALSILVGLTLWARSDVAGRARAGAADCGLATGLALGSAGIYASSGAVISNMALLTVADMTPPTVAITSPVNSATVSGTVSIAGTAADNVAVAKVEVQIDAGAFNLASGTANWTYSINTGALTNGSHTLTPY